MKLYGVIVLLLFLSMLFLPLFSLFGEADGHNNEISSVFAAVDSGVKEENLTDKGEASTASTQNSTEAVSEISENDASQSVAVLMTESGEVNNVDIFEYTVGCVAGEMPASYEKEALKAQAVVSYTYALYMKGKSGSKQDELTDDSAVNQSYMTKKEMKEKWGDSYEKYLKIYESAFNEVKGEYITYGGEIIKPAFHAVSSGRTNSAEALWGKEVPYLVSCPSEGDKLSENYITTVCFTQKQLNKCFEKYIDGDFSIDEIESDNNRLVKKAVVSSKSFTGEEFRKILSLRSPSFAVTQEKNKYKFTCYGYGHGVGMSQNGANFMAKQGMTYDEILKHYYKGIKIENVKSK